MTQLLAGNAIASHYGTTVDATPSSQYGTTIDGSHYGTVPTYWRTRRNLQGGSGNRLFSYVYIESKPWFTGTPRNVTLQREVSTSST